MLKFQLATPEDLKVAATIERKRQIEEARKPRIFDPRSRRIGIDKEFLDKQIVEKKTQRQLERAEECRMDEALVRSSQFAIRNEKREEEERRKINAEINTFRQVYQRAEDRRDFDLYDPDRLKKSLPARTCDEDPRLGPASAQKFEGEDWNYAERMKIQREQMQAWLYQQMTERRIAEQERQQAERAYQDAVCSRDKRAVELDRMSMECRRRLNEATARFNRALAEEQEHRRRCEALQDEEDKRAEIYNHVTGDFLTEAKEQADSNRGPNKPLASRYKGMTSDQLKVFRDEQARQMEEIEKMKRYEKRRDEEWDQLMNGNAKTAEKYHRQLELQRGMNNKRIAEENLQLAHQQKCQQEYLRKVVYKNKPSPEFFEQFNKSTR
ncbi:RIB43A-like with coiled-coils protein 2 [Venturia canescens]|uniref:RIB43A-like with coiled-coils protein 2 n=1 Tax=Venturia canescens TaxID=32260 RepID=UPI001C9CA45F|nr:RIB43A-like with coiled-coils protein 2 [Venturia canescens]XP_043276629.1 RIB43A-like with coiled-coils protein 2 [Venturia canescens]